MNHAEHRIIELALKIQSHRDRIAVIRSGLKRCEFECGGHEACYYERRDGKNAGADFDDWCDACKENLPLLAEKRIEQGMANGALRRLTEWARKVRAEGNYNPDTGRWAGEACRFRAGIEEILLCRATANAISKPMNTGADVAEFYETALRGLLAGKRVERSGDGLLIYGLEGI